MDLRKVAMLAHLELTAQEVQEFSGQLESVLKHVASLQEVGSSVALTDGKPPVLATPLRDDKIDSEHRVVAAVDLVNLSEGNVGHCFEVPQVVG